MPANTSSNGLAMPLNLGLAYSAKYIADISPTGTATHMATRDICKVPTKRGTAPNEPDAPTWSARIAVCGLQCVPVINSQKEIWLKNRSDSNSTERTIPSVVNIAIMEQAISTARKVNSDSLRAA